MADPTPGTGSSPSVRDLPEDLVGARGLLDELLLRLPSADPGLPREEAALGLSSALTHVYGALASGGNANLYLLETAAALEGAQRALASIEPHSRQSPEAADLAARIALAAEVIARAPYRTRLEPSPLPRPGQPRPWLRATIGEPALLEFDRSFIEPVVPLLDPGESELELPVVDLSPEAPHLAMPELEALLARGLPKEEPIAPAPNGPAEPAREPPPPPSSAELERAYLGEPLTAPDLLYEQARICLEEMATLGVMRRPRADEGWSECGLVEQRILSRVDAIAACGAPILPRLVRLLEGRPIPDPELTWALLFLFGCMAGDDAFDQLFRLASLAPLADSPEMLDSVADALALVPHPSVSPGLRDWLEDPMLERRVVAVRALSRRNALETGPASAAAREADPRLAQAGAKALAVIPGPVDPRTLWAALQHSESRVVRAGLETALIRRADLGTQRALALVTGGKPDFAGAAPLLALTGGPEVLELLLSATEAGSAGAIEGLGWLGRIEAIDVLLGRLEGKESQAALRALQRITGASLTAQDPCPEYEPGDLPFRRPDGPVPEQQELLADPAAWREWWKRHQKEARPGVRYRFGHRWSVHDALEELQAPDSLCGDRRLAHLELCTHARSSSPFDAEAFVARQRLQLQAWSVLLGPRPRARSGSRAAPEAR